jgi:hypothetical protein
MQNNADKMSDDAIRLVPGPTSDIRYRLPPRSRPDSAAGLEITRRIEVKSRGARGSAHRRTGCCYRSQRRPAPLGTAIIGRSKRATERRAHPFPHPNPGDTPAGDDTVSAEAENSAQLRVLDRGLDVSNTHKLPARFLRATESGQVDFSLWRKSNDLSAPCSILRTSSMTEPI